MTDSTTIALDEGVKEDLDALKVHENESYNDVVARLLDDEPGDDRVELIEDIRSQLERLDSNYERPENDPVDYAEIETRMERVIERMIR